MTSSEVKGIVGGFLAQVRGLFSGLEKLPSILEEIERREQGLSQREGRAAQLEASVAQLGAEEVALQQSLQGLHQKVGSAKADHDATMQPLRAEREQLLREVAALRTERDGVKADLQRIRAGLPV